MKGALAMSQKYTGNIALTEMVAKTKEHVEGVRATLDSNKQNKTLSTSITIEGTEATTVEGALGTLNSSKQGILQYTVMPGASADNVERIIQYTGSDPTYTIGGFYQCRLDSGTGTYSWVEISASITVDTALSSVSTNAVENRVIKTAIDEKQDTIEVSTMPVASVANLGKVYIYVGTTTADYVQGQAYLCVLDTETSAYKWETTTSKVTVDNTTIQENTDGELEIVEKTWTGTTADWEALSASDKAKYTFVNLTDDLAGGNLIVTDYVTSGDLNPITSNAVYVGLSGKQDELTFDATPTSESTNPVTSGGVKTALDNKVDWESNGILGAKNFIPYPYYETTSTKSGITFTDNGNGSVTVSGTATAKANFWFKNYSDDFILPEGNYILSDGGVGNSSATVFVAQYSGSTWISQDNVFDSGEITFSVSHSSSYDRTPIGISIADGTTLDSVTFYPMVRLATDTDDTYQPYAMTNQKLTSQISKNLKFELIGTSTSTTGEVLSTDLTKYDAILIISSASNVTTTPNPVSSSLFPISLFKIAINVQARWPDNGSDIFALCQYTSDSSVNLKTSSATYMAWLYGVYTE